LVAIRAQSGFRRPVLRAIKFLSAALQEIPGLIDDSMRQNVMLATPTSWLRC